MRRNRFIVAALLLIIILGSALQISYWRFGRHSLGLGELITTGAIVLLTIFGPREAAALDRGRLSFGGRLLLGAVVLLLIAGGLWLIYNRYFVPMNGILNDPDSTLI
jgi:hypothetical protein